MRAAVLLLAALTIAAAPPGRSTMHHATGTFTVTLTPEGNEPATDTLAATARMGIAKTFSGAMTGEARGTMLSVGTPGPGSAAFYVATDRFHGSVDGRAGGFVLLHRGIMRRDGRQELEVLVAPDSGTGALAGIEGRLSIAIEDGVHRYDLAYTVPTG